MKWTASWKWNLKCKVAVRFFYVKEPFFHTTAKRRKLQCNFQTCNTLCIILRCQMITCTYRVLKPLVHKVISFFSVKLKVKGFICSHRRSKHVARVQCEVNGGTNLICYEGFTTGAQSSQLFVALTFLWVWKKLFEDTVPPTKMLFWST